MKISNTSERLKQIMSERNLRQVDILNSSKHFCDIYGVKMNKSDISQYCSGKVEPNQDKLFVLSAALNVNVSWLMGYDTPQEPYAYAAARRDIKIYNALEDGLKSFNWDIALEQIDDDTIQYILSNDVCSITVSEECITELETKLKRFLLKELQDIFIKQNESMFNSEECNTSSPESIKNQRQPTTLAAHFDGDKYTDTEKDEINQFAEFVKGKREK